MVVQGVEFYDLACTWDEARSVGCSVFGGRADAVAGLDERI
jgi:hypothetical protein